MLHAAWSTIRSSLLLTYDTIGWTWRTPSNETSNKIGLLFSGTTYAEQTCFALLVFPSIGHDVSTWRSTQPRHMCTVQNTRTMTVSCHRPHKNPFLCCSDLVYQKLRSNMFFNNKLPVPTALLAKSSILKLENAILMVPTCTPFSLRTFYIPWWLQKTTVHGAAHHWQTPPARPWRPRVFFAGPTFLSTCPSSQRAPQQTHKYHVIYIVCIYIYI